MKAQVYKDPRPKEYFDRFHERSRTREPDWVYEVVRTLTSLYAWTFFRARGIAAENVPTGPVIIAPNHFSFMDHFFVGAFIRRRVRFMAKSQLFERPMQFVYSHGGVFPVRRGYRDEDAFVTANSILERGGLIVMYCEGGRSRTGKLSEQPKRGIGRIALESGATVVPAAIHGSSKVRNWKRLQFPKVTVQYGEPMRWEAVADPTADQQQQVANEIFAQIRGLYAGLDALGRKGVARRLREARAAPPAGRALPPDVLAARGDRVVGVGEHDVRTRPAVDAVDRAVDLGDAIVALAAQDRVAALGARDRVVAGAAVDDVRAVAALDRVVALVAEHGVVAEAAEQLVVVAAAVHDVLSGLAVDVVARLVAEQLVVAVLAEQRVRRGRAEERVVAGGAADDRRRRGVGRGLRRDLEDLLAARELVASRRGALDVDGVMAGAAGGDVGAVVGDAEHVVATAAEDLVRAGAADHGVGAVAARDVVVVGAAVEGVGAVRAVDAVAARVALDVVVAAAAEEAVAGAAAVDRVVAGAAVDLLGAGLAEEGVVAVAAVDQAVRAATAADHVVARARRRAGRRCRGRPRR